MFADEKGGELILYANKRICSLINRIDMNNVAIIAMNDLDAHRAMVITGRTNNAFVAGMLTASIRALKTELAKRIVKITFLKKDGTITTRFATTLPSFAGKSSDIADPWYTGNFDETYRDVVEGCEAFLQYLVDNNEI